MSAAADDGSPSTSHGTNVCHSVARVGLPRQALRLPENGQTLDYGPYADNLRHVLNRIEGHYVRGFGDGRNKPDTPLELIGDAAAEAEAFLHSTKASQERLDRVAALIEGFETPFGMELLSTVHWIAMGDGGAATSGEEAVRAVHAGIGRPEPALRRHHRRLLHAGADGRAHPL